MYIHLGNNVVVNSNDVVAIIDIEKTTVSKNTRIFLEKAQKRGIVVNISYELPKSAVICKYKEETKVYISQISPTTLQGRHNKNKFI